VKLERHGKRDDDDKPTCNHRGVDAWMVRRLILVPEHRTTNNTTNTTSTDQSSGAKSSLPLATDVVCLVREYTGNIGVASDGGEEDAEIANAVRLCEAEEWEA
jgi:hypothetical protein